MARKYFEDFETGFNHQFTVPGLTPEAIRDFAEKYDPQRFHLDEEEARKTHFGGLVASGFQTQLLCFEPFCREILTDARGIGAPGIDELKWLRPWYPGEALNVSVELKDKRLSAKREDRGYLNFRLEARADQAPTFIMDWMVIVLTRKSKS